MRPLFLVITAAALLGACKGDASTHNECLDRCTRVQSPLERSTCELGCSQQGKAPAPAPVASAPDPGMMPTPAAPPTPVAPVAQPTPTPVAQPKPVTPVAPVTPVVVTRPAPGPSPAELQRQRAMCESTCAGEATGADKATCRVECAQITDRPSSSSTTPTTGGGTTTAPADPAAIARCQSNCNATGSSETDRATCRLNCSAVGTVGPPPTGGYVLRGTPPASDADRGNVIRSSGGVVQGGSSSQPVDPQRAAQCSSQAQTCSANCATSQAPCQAECSRGKLSATDRATCDLTCETNVEVCRDDCRVQEGKCRGTK